MLRDGDKNTTFFHSKVSNRRKRNRIKWLVDKHGIKHKNIEGMQIVVVEFFSDLFDSSRPEITVDHLDFIENRISSSMEDHLLKPYTREEITDAPAEMHPCKSPGLDGFTALFYKKY